MWKTAGFAICWSLLAAVPAVAQTPTGAVPPPDQTAPAEPPGRQHAIIGGKDIQPRPIPGQSGQNPEAKMQLLHQNSRDKDSREPIVVPRDLYGNPLGGSPGANPPGLEPVPSPESAKAQATPPSNKP